MVSVSNVDPARIAELLEDFSTDVRTVLPPVLSIRNGRRSVVITGTPEQLARFELYCSKITEKEEAERKNKLRGGAVFSPSFASVQVEVGFHTPRLAEGVEFVDRWAAKIGIDADLAHEMTESIFVRPSTGSPRSSGCTTPEHAGSSTSGPVTPSPGSPHPSSAASASASSPRPPGRVSVKLFTVGAAPEVAPAWSSYAPSVISLPNGSPPSSPPSSPGSPGARRCCSPA